MNGFRIYFTQVFDFAHFFQIFTVAFAIVCVLSPIKRSGKAVGFAAVKLLSVCAVSIVLESFLFFISTLTKGKITGIVFPLTYLIIIAVYAVLMCKFDAKVRIISSGLLFASIVMVTECIKNFAFLLSASDSLIALIVILINCLNLLTAFIFSHYGIEKFNSLSTVSVALVMMSSVAVVITEFIYSGVFAIIFDNYRTANFTYTGISGTVLYVIIISVYLLFYFICESNAKIAQLQLQEKLMRTTADMTELMQKTLSDIRRLRHDAKNHYAYMRILLDNGQYDELNNYLNSVSEEVLNPLPYVDCPNKTISNVLNMEKAKADLHGIGFITELNVPPVLPFDDVMLCSVFTNLIDNAIEACQRYSVNGDIRVTATVRSDYLYIVVVNPILPTVDKDKILEMNTVKSNTLEHGYGTQIVKRIAERYDGVCSYTIENDVFVAEIMLSLVEGNAG